MKIIDDSRFEFDIVKYTQVNHYVRWSWWVDTSTFLQKVYNYLVCIKKYDRGTKIRDRDDRSFREVSQELDSGVFVIYHICLPISSQSPIYHRPVSLVYSQSMAIL